jgi:hypothetical protein
MNAGAWLSHGIGWVTQLIVFFVLLQQFHVRFNESCAVFCLGHRVCRVGFVCKFWFCSIIPIEQKLKCRTSRNFVHCPLLRQQNSIRLAGVRWKFYGLVLFFAIKQHQGTCP